MTGRISQGGLLVILAFTVPVIVELRTLAGLLGVHLTAVQYVAVAGALVLGVLAAVAVWNDRIARMEADEHSEGA